MVLRTLETIKGRQADQVCMCVCGCMHAISCQDYGHTFSTLIIYMHVIIDSRSFFFFSEA